MKEYKYDHSKEARMKRAAERHSDNGRATAFWRKVLISVIGLVIFVFFGFHLVSLIWGSDIAKQPEGVAAKVINPIQSGFSAVVDWVHDYLYSIKLRSRIEKEYNALKQENEQLMYRVMLLEELEHKLTVYENLYDEISVNESLNPLVATVIGRENGNYFSVFTINKGRNDGIQDFMAVTVDGALVGYTYNVSATTSTVRTIIDSEASIAALLSSSRDQGTVRGTLDIDSQPLCRMYYLPEDKLPRPGDQVVTSGVGMSFPKGIPIGTVRESTRGMESNKSYVVIEPAADFQHVEYVIVLRYQPVAGAVEDRSDENGDIVISPLDTPRPVPTIMIGTDFYQLAPTAVPTATPEPEILFDEEGNPVLVTPAPTPENDDTIEYHDPSATAVGISYGFTPAPTASPSPTPEALDLSVEEE